LTIPLAIIIGWLVVTTTVGVLAGINRRFSVEEYFVGGRSFGVLLFYTVAAAEIYSAFAFLGLAGWAYGKGMSIVYALAYGSIAYGLYFFVGPRINRLGRRAGYVTQPDFFEDRYGSRVLSVLTALIGVVFIVPYLQLQLMGSGMIVQIASGGAIGWKSAVLLSVAAIVIFVYVSGLRGIGWTNLLQAVIMLGGMVAVGLLFPRHFYGGVDIMFDTLERLRPEHLTLPDSAGLGLSWYTSTALLCGLGMWMWPHVFAATYSARSERVVRRNATVLPLYQLALVPVIVVGFTCAAKGAEDPEFSAAIAKPDHAMLIALVDHFPPWFSGLIGAGGLAASISTASALILTAANLLSRNVVRAFRPQMGEQRAAWLGRFLVPVVTGVAVVFVYLAPEMLVSLLLTGFSGISQFVPAVLLGLFGRWPTRAGVLAGLLAGLVVVAGCHLADLKLLVGIHPGFVGLAVNVAVLTIVSLLTKKIGKERIERFEKLLAEDGIE
jgi:SSS family solute:Na+ symporter